MASHEEKEKKPIYKKGWFWIVIVFFIFWSIGMSQKTNTDTNKQTSSTIQESNSETNQDVSKVIYEDNNFLVKITNYEYSKITNSIKVNLYIENNSDKDTTFTIDGNTSINDIMVEGGYFYQEVNAKTKANASFTLSNLKDNNINESNLEKMQFKFDIYQSKNYIIENRIVDDLQVTYEF